MAFNTGNPIGSTDARDLSDNAQNFDEAINDRAATTWTDRLGVARKTVWGAFSEITYKAPVSYVIGLSFLTTDANKTVEEAGVVYAPLNSALPFTTSGTFSGDDDGRFYPVQDKNNVIRVTTIADIEAYSAPDGYVFSLNAGGRSGTFDVVAGDFSAELANDTVNAVYIGLADNPAGTTKAAVRRTGGETNLLWFILDGETSVSDAFTRAFASFTRPGTLQVPQGFLNIDETVVIRSDITIKIVGQGMFSTVIYYSGALDTQTMFKHDGTGIVDTFSMSEMTLIGASKAGSGYISNQIISSNFTNISVQGTTNTAIATNDGYSNTFSNVKIFSNLGSGISCTGVNNNNINIENSQIYANQGIGVELGNGFSLTIRGSVVEQNDVAGVIAYNLEVLTIRDSYFERNASIGYSYTTADGSPENINIKSDIHLLSGGKTIGGTLATSCHQVTIDSVQFTPYGTGDVPTSGLSIDSSVFATVVDGLRVINCEVLDESKVENLVSFYNNSTKSQAQQCVIDGNTVNSVGFLGTSNTSFVFSTLHNIDTPLKQSPHNYAPQDLSEYPAISGTTGQFRRLDRDFQGYPVYSLEFGNRTYAHTFDLTAYPELNGKLVWFGAWFTAADAGSSLVLRLNGVSSEMADGPVPDAAYIFKSVCKYIAPDETSLTISFQRVGTGSAPVNISAPVLSAFGFGANRYPVPNVNPVFRGTAPPTSGAWDHGDRIVNSDPTVGQPKAFVCTVSGFPGTWFSEGNL